MALTKSHNDWFFADVKCKELETKLAEAEVTLAKLLITPPEMAVEIMELQYLPIIMDEGSPRYHIFVRARIALQKPNSVRVYRYQLTMIWRGHTESPKQYEDVHEWQCYFFTLESMMMRFFQLPVLEHELVSGNPLEGWLHFITEPTIIDHLGESVMRLTVDTGQHKTYGETKNKFMDYIDRNRTITVYGQIG